MQSGTESSPLAFSVASANLLVPVADSHDVRSHTVSLGDSVVVVCSLNFTMRYTCLWNIFSRTFTFSETFTVERTHTLS